MSDLSSPTLVFPSAMETVYHALDIRRGFLDGRGLLAFGGPGLPALRLQTIHYRRRLQ
jgi:hypothetical protein